MWGDRAQPLLPRPALSLARAPGPAGQLGQIRLGRVGCPCLAFSVSTARSPGGAAAGREAPAHRPGCQKPGHTASRAKPGGACECHGRTDKLAWAAARGRGGETGMHSRLWSDLPAPGRLMDTVPASTCTSPPHAGRCPPGNRTVVKTEVTIGVKLVVGALGASPHLRTVPVRAACVTSLTPAPCHAVLSMFCR